MYYVIKNLQVTAEKKKTSKKKKKEKKVEEVPLAAPPQFQQPGHYLRENGVIAGIWAEKFDQLAAFQNFIIMPATFLSGVFYSIHSLPPVWQTVSHFNPFFYLIDGFRHGFFGVSDVSPWFSLGVGVVAWAILTVIAMRMVTSGYKLRG